MSRQQRSPDNHHAELLRVRRECEELAARELAEQGPPPLTDHAQRVIRATFTVKSLVVRPGKEGR